MQPYLKSALRHLLKPLVKFLLKRGVSHGEFSEEAKRMMLIGARSLIKQEGKKPTDSRIAASTGLTRKDVKRIRELIEDDSPDDLQQESAFKASRATSVLRGWHDDPDFCDERGYPRDLPLADSDNNFAALVKRYSGDITTNAMLEELQRMHAVEVSKDSSLRVLRRSLIPENPGDEAMVRIASTAIHDLIKTLDENLSSTNQEQRKFQRTVSNTRIPASALPVIQRIVNERGQEFLEMLDGLLSSYEIDEKNSRNKPKTKTLRTGVGLYFFNDEEDEGEEQ